MAFESFERTSEGRPRIKLKGWKLDRKLRSGRSSYTGRIYFSPPMAKEMELDKYTHLQLFVDEKAQKLGLMPTNTPDAKTSASLSMARNIYYFTSADFSAKAIELGYPLDWYLSYSRDEIFILEKKKLKHIGKSHKKTKAEKDLDNELEGLK